MLILEQIVETFLAVPFVVVLGGNTPRAFDDVTHLEKFTEIGFFFVGNIGFDRLLTLKPSGWVEMTTAVTTSQIRHTIHAGIGPRDLVSYSGRFTAIPAEQTLV